MAETWSGEFYCVKCKEKREAEGEVQGQRQGHPDGQGRLPRVRHQPQPHPRQGLSTPRLVTRRRPPTSVGGAVVACPVAAVPRPVEVRPVAGRAAAACRHGSCGRRTVPYDAARPPTARPVLRPGLRVFRRDDAHLQVGIDQPRVVLPDTDGVRPLLRRAARTAPASASLTPDAGLALGHLVDAGLVVERPTSTRRPAAGPEAAATAAFAAHGPDGADPLAARAGAGSRSIAPEPWLATAVADWSRRVARWPPPSPAHRRARARRCWSARASPHGRGRIALVRADRTHLLVALLPDRALLGPFVVPGATACLRCVDAHLGEHDPRRALVLEQVEEAADPCEPGLAHAALALAVRELTSYAEGDRPPPGRPRSRSVPTCPCRARGYRRHLHCGCAGPDPRWPRVGRDHHHSESSWDSIARRCSREQVSQKVRWPAVLDGVRPRQGGRLVVGLLAAEVAGLHATVSLTCAVALTRRDTAEAKRRRQTGTEAGYDEWSSYPASVVTAIRSSGEVSRGRGRARVAPAVRPAQPCG